MSSQVYSFEKVVKPRRQWTEADKEDVLARYDFGRGQSFKEIGRVYDVSDTAIRRWVTEWGAFVPKQNPKPPKKKEEDTETPLDKAIRLLGTRVRVDTYGDGICVYRLDDKRINPYFLIDIAGVQRGRAWV